MTGPEPEQPEAPEPNDDPAERVLRIFLEEPMLWPVGLVVALTFVTFGAAILVYALRLQAIVAGIALLLMIFGTVWGLDQDVRSRRLRPRSAVILGLWIGSAIVAFVLDRLGALS